MTLLNKKATTNTGEDVTIIASTTFSNIDYLESFDKTGCIEEMKENQEEYGLENEDIIIAVRDEDGCKYVLTLSEVSIEN